MSSMPFEAAQQFGLHFLQDRGDRLVEGIEDRLEFDLEEFLEVLLEA